MTDLPPKKDGDEPSAPASAGSDSPSPDRAARGSELPEGELESHFSQAAGYPDWTFEDAEFEHPNSTLLPPWLSQRHRTQLADVTHVERTRRGFRLGTRSNTHTFLARHFSEPGDCDRLIDGLKRRISALPGGAAQLEAISALDRVAAEPARNRVSLGVTLLCALAFLLQMVDHPDVLFAGDFKPALFRLGEFWRAITANLLHSSLGHFLLNLIGLRLLGNLVERPLGGSSAFLVLVASALGAMTASYVADYHSVVGASGMVFGLAGAILCIEIHHPQSLPVAWRLPRRILVGAILAETLLMTFVPVVAGAAHAGGLVAGYVTARLITLDGLSNRPRWLEKVAAPLAAACLLSIGAAVWSHVASTPAAVVERAERLLAVEGLEPAYLNNAAWQIAISDTPTHDELSIAERLATRAVEATERGDPHLLDTLAEVQFALGRSEDAISIIDEAIALDPNESYYREQRKRFEGLRGAADRPADPSSL